LFVTTLSAILTVTKADAENVFAESESCPRKEIMATQPLPKKPKSEPTRPQIVEKPRTKDWTRPQAMAIPKGGFFEDRIEQGRYGPIFPQTPACYGFSVIAKVIPGMEEHLYNNAQVMEKQ
jgi:hypothetical protein